MMLPRLASGIAAFVLLVPGSVVVAGERIEKALSLEAKVAAGRTFDVENLIGSITVRGGSDSRRGQVSARVVVEADTVEVAQAIADEIRLDLRSTDAADMLHVTYPVERHTAFRMPRSEVDGLFSKWVSPLVRKQTVSVQYDGQTVELGQAKGATAVAVHLTVVLPFDIDSTFRQVVGTIHGVGLRGDNGFEIVEGKLVVDKSYGKIRARTGGGDVSVNSFRGGELAVHTSSGAVELSGVETERAELRTTSGAVRAREISASALTVDTDSGPVVLGGVDVGTFAVNSGSGEVDLAARLRRTKDATIQTVSGDVTLRVGELSYFDLRAEAPDGRVKARGLDVEVAPQEPGVTRVQHGHGGTDLHIKVSDGAVTVRPI